MVPQRILVTGVLGNSDSSARVEYNGSSVAVSVHGPVESKNQAKGYNGVMVDVTVRIPSGIPGTRERSFEESLRSIAQRCIKSTVRQSFDVIITFDIVSESQYLFPACVIALMAALRKSTIPLQDLAAASVYNFRLDGASSNATSMELVVSMKSRNIMFCRMTGLENYGTNLSELTAIAMERGNEERQVQLEYILKSVSGPTKPW